MQMLPKFPCHFPRLYAIYLRNALKSDRLYSSHKPLPKTPICNSELADMDKNTFEPLIEKTEPPVKLLGQDEVKKIINGKKTWREIKIDYSKLGKHCLKLSKFRLTSLVVITSAVGYALPSTPFDPLTFLCCTIGTGLVSSAANSVNQFLEVPFDAQMSRTRNRVLVQGHLMPLHAVGFAALTSTAGLLMLYYGNNPLTAALGATNLVLYTVVYTPLKRISIINTWVGSVVGAIPPLMGWAACEGSLGCGSLIVGGILYAWQFPHFNALSWNLRLDYSRAGYRMMSVTDPGLCRRTALRYTVGIIALSSLAPLLELTHWSFLFLSLPVNMYFTLLAYKFYKESNSSTSRKLFRFSLLHLPMLLTLMILTKKEWGFLSVFRESTKEKTVNAAKNENLINDFPVRTFTSVENLNFSGKEFEKVAF